MVEFTVKNTDIINYANELVKGQGDGRISQKDIDMLFSKFTFDTPDNLESLIYIVTNYNLTHSAKDEFLKKLSSRK